MADAVLARVPDARLTFDLAAGAARDLHPDANPDNPALRLDDEVDGSAFLIKPGKVRRPPGTSIDLWRLTHGGFPDGDTAMSPPAEAKRTKRARQ